MNKFGLKMSLTYWNGWICVHQKTGLITQKHVMITNYRVSHNGGASENGLQNLEDVFRFNSTNFGVNRMYSRVSLFPAIFVQSHKFDWDQCGIGLVDGAHRPLSCLYNDDFVDNGTEINSTETRQSVC